MQFEGINNAGFGNYPDGFVPNGDPSLAASVPGCIVADDFSKQLGDPLEGRLAAALQYRSDKTCPIDSSITASKRAGIAAASPEPQFVKTPLRENRWLPKRF